MTSAPRVAHFSDQAMWHQLRIVKAIITGLLWEGLPLRALVYVPAAKGIWEFLGHALATQWIAALPECLVTKRTCIVFF